MKLWKKSISAVCTAALFCAVMGAATPSCVIAQVRTLVEAPPPVKRKSDKIDFLFKASRPILAAGTTVDLYTTVHNLDHPTTAYRADGTLLTRYYVVEKGWARYFGDRGPFAASTANAVLNTGVVFLSSTLYLRGGRWRYVAVGLMLAKAGASFYGGVQNERFLGSIDGRVRRETGYQGVILWSR